MSRLRERKTKIVIEALPDTAIIRLLGTRVKYEVSWRGVHDLGARIAVSHRPVGKRRGAA